MNSAGSNEYLRKVVHNLCVGGVSTLSLSAVSTQVAAQDKPAAGAAPDSGELQEVVITGIRASLQKSMDIKQNAVGVVDAISAEDIGQFPDASLGEAIARIPGVTVNRGSINQNTAAGAPTATGAATGITVRGFGTQFNEALVEGRQVASGAGQSFDFSTLGAEYVGEVDVLKTPDYSLSAGAIGATINVKFPNPFDHEGFQARAFGSATDYTNDGGVRPAFGALVSDTFADGTFGILISGDYTDKHILGHHFDIVGWKGAHLDCAEFAANPAGSGCATVGTGATGTSVTPSWYIQDQAMYLERTDSRRKDGRVALQWHPTDAVLVTVDDNFASDDEHTNRWQYSTWFGGFPSGVSNVTQDANGTITNFTNSNGPTDFNAFVAEDYIVTNTPGLNVRWDINENWTSALDIAQSSSKLNPHGNYSDLDVDVGYGPNTGLGTNGYTGGSLVSPNSNVVPYWTAIGPNSNATTGPAVAANYLGTNPFIIGSHVAPIQVQENSEKINQVKLDATWHTDTTKVHFGAQFVDDLWNSKELDTFTNNEWQLWSGYGPASNNFVTPGGIVHGVALPAALFTSIPLTNFIPHYQGNGNLPQGLNLFSPYAVLNYLITQPINADYTESTGYPTYSGGYPTPVLSPGSYQHVDRKNYAPFVTVDHDFQLGAMMLKADLGLRYQKTKVDIAGLAAPLVSLGTQPGDVTAYQINVSSTPTYTTASNTYGYFLPSLDLNLLVLPNLKVRADFSRTETPSNNFQLIPNTTYNGRVNALTATGNNPKLLPYLSNNFDLGAEWYYGSNDYVSADGFMKRVTQFPVSSVQTITVPGIIDPSPLSTNFNQLAQFAETTVVNGLSANVTGLEVTWQQMLAWGFGFQINGTYVHSNRNFDPYSTTSNQFALPGIGNSANLIAFYQANGLQARLAVQWQGEQLLQLGQEQSGGAFGNEPVYLESGTEVDFSTSYDVDSHVGVFLEALNLTDQVYHTRGRFSNQTLNLVDYGRSYTLGVRVKF